jgi:hypothetical protein
MTAKKGRMLDNNKAIEAIIKTPCLSCFLPIFFPNNLTIK